MSAIKNLPDNYNLLSPVSFKFQIKKLETVSYFCQNVNLPGLSLGEFTRVTPFIDYPMPGDKITYDDLSVSFLVDEDMTNYIELINWMKNLGSTENPAEQYKTLVNDKSANVLRGITSDCTLTILTNNMNANKSVVFEDCFPTTLSEISFESVADDVTPITASATFKFRDFSIKAVT
tara:strand:+ start:214 stop:744 length:531 start_codon:yes stop_codon:yes gene_type:complete